MHLLAGDMTPWMFHQANLYAYDGSRTLLTDLLGKVLREVSRPAGTCRCVTWPMSKIASRMRARTEFGVGRVRGDHRARAHDQPPLDAGHSRPYHGSTCR